VVTISGTGGLVLAFTGYQRAACLVGLPGQWYWLSQTWGGPREFFIVALAATAAYLLGIWLHWVRPWWQARSERLRRASW
jgi:hypothetical protein